MSMDFISVREVSRKWAVSERRIHQYCKDGRIEGAVKFGHQWMIPADALKPQDPRKRPADPAPQPVNRSGEGSSALTETKVGAVITVSSDFEQEGAVFPFMDVEGISLLRRMVVTLQQADVGIIVVVTGYHHWEIKWHLSGYPVVFLRNEQFETTDRFYASVMGIRFLQDKCRKILLMNLRNPLLHSDTVRSMSMVDAGIVIPQIDGRNGHPILLDQSVLPQIMSYTGDEGMRGAIRLCPDAITYLNVDDPAVRLSVQAITESERHLTDWHRTKFHPFVQIQMEHSLPFFDENAKNLLLLIQEYHSVQAASEQMTISRSKAWSLIRAMEKELHLPLVKRRRGGSFGGRTELTKEGEIFLTYYIEYERDVKSYANRRFREGYDRLLSDLYKDHDSANTDT